MILSKMAKQLPDLPLKIINQNILIIEDEAIIALNQKEELSKNGFKIDIAYSISESLEKMKLKKYGVIILDIILPDGESINMIPTIKEMQMNSRLIVYSALSDSNTIVGCMNLGADGYIRKTYDEEKFIKLVESYYA